MSATGIEAVRAYRDEPFVRVVEAPSGRLAEVYTNRDHASTNPFR